MDKLAEHAKRMLEIHNYSKGKKLTATSDISQAVYDLILRVQSIEAKERKD